MQGIIDKVKEVTGQEHDYPAKPFTSGFTPYPDPSIVLEEQEQNQPGERPGKQTKARLQAVDDIYANGKPYVGANKLEGKKALISGGDSGVRQRLFLIKIDMLMYCCRLAVRLLSYLRSKAQTARSDTCRPRRKMRRTPRNMSSRRLKGRVHST